MYSSAFPVREVTRRFSREIIRRSVYRNTLNKQDSAIKYTTEFENYKYSLNFLDININDTTNKKYVFKVHRKDTITKSESSINPSITKSVLKSFVHRTHTICSEKYVKHEI